MDIPTGFRCRYGATDSRPVWLRYHILVATTAGQNRFDRQLRFGWLLGATAHGPLALAWRPPNCTFSLVAAFGPIQRIKESPERDEYRDCR